MTLRELINDLETESQGGARDNHQVAIVIMVERDVFKGFLPKLYSDDVGKISVMFGSLETASDFDTPKDLSIKKEQTKQRRPLIV